VELLAAIAHESGGDCNLHYNHYLRLAKTARQNPRKEAGSREKKTILRVATADFGDLRGAIQKNSPTAGREARAAREALVVGLVPMAWNSEQVELSRPKNLVRIRDGPSRPCS